MKKFPVMLCVFLFVNDVVFAAEQLYQSKDIKSSDMLCPFTVDIYPTKILTGDTVYLRMNFTNTKDHFVFVPADPLYVVSIHFGILTYYFADREGNEYVWKKYGLNGDWLGRGDWRKIPPGKEWLLHYEVLSFEQTRKLKCWDEMKSETMEGHVAIRFLCCNDHLNDYLYSSPQLRVYSRQWLSISPRSPKEMKLIEKAMTSKKYQATCIMLLNIIHHSIDRFTKVPRPPDQIFSALENYEGATKEEMQRFCDKISKGTLKNNIQFQTYFVDLAFQAKDQNLSEQMKILEKIEKWLDTLDEQEREILTMHARSFKSCFLSQNNEAFLIKFDQIFGMSPPMPPLPEVGKME